MCVFYGWRACINCKGLKKEPCSNSPLQSCRRSVDFLKFHFTLQGTYPSPDNHFTLFRWFYDRFFLWREKRKKGGAVLQVAKRWHTMYGGKRMVIIVVAVLSVFNLEPGERLCFLCWESSVSRTHTGGRGGGGGRRRRSWVGEQISCFYPCHSTSPNVAAFTLKWAWGYIAVAFHLSPPPFISCAEQCGVTANLRMWQKLMVTLMISVCVCMCVF